jgi:hypothetical protein
MRGALTPGRAVGGVWYLSALLMAPVLYSFVTALVGDAIVFGALPWSLVALYGTTIVALVTWLGFRGGPSRDALMRYWLMLGVVVWLYVLLSESRQGESVVAAAALVPLTLFLILLKRPSRTDSWMAADAFAWTVVATSAIILLLEVSHAIPTWYSGQGQYGVDLMVFDRSAYWLPLRGLLGLEGRWGGASGFPNISGQAGALLVVYGVVRPIGRRWAFMLSGIVIMLLTDSRTSYAAGAVGLCLLASLPGWGATYWKVTPARVIALALGIGMAIRVVLKVLMDPNLTGRMAMWPEFLALARRFLPFGGGQQVIDSAISSGQLPAWAHQGHNLFLDTLVRHGAVGLLLTVAFIGIAFILTARPVRRELAAGLALLAALVTSCMGDLGIDWTYPSEGLSVLLVAVLVSQVEPRVPERPSDGAVTASSPSPLG